MGNKFNIRKFIEETGDKNVEGAINQLVNYLRNTSSLEDPMEGVALLDILTEIYRKEGVIKEPSDKDIKLLEENIERLVNSNEKIPNWIVGVTMKAIDDYKEGGN